MTKFCSHFDVVKTILGSVVGFNLARAVFYPKQPESYTTVISPPLENFFPFKGHRCSPFTPWNTIRSIPFFMVPALDVADSVLSSVSTTEAKQARRSVRALKRDMKRKQKAQMKRCKQSCKQGCCQRSEFLCSISRPPVPSIGRAVLAGIVAHSVRRHLLWGRRRRTGTVGFMSGFLAGCW
eukprot:gnl/Dysnectes_brevis/3046_a3772_717.p2 GENE.gnl/Dysnectes_brevis/3046_a3772_717~~gnl/Dysnectes_brevis/3046_a3772_717.p2  ORF type:complete len:181 (-),score=3.13 gnl/Dysnectes_brevis/3046_a3772_717:101-643(-)